MAAGAAAAISVGWIMAATAQEEPKGLRPGTWSDDVSACADLGFAKDPPWTIGVSNYSLGNSWRVQMIEELKVAAAKDSRIAELVITNSDGNAAKQLSDIEDLRSRDVDGLIIAPLSSDGAAPAVDEAVADGVPVVIFNNEIATDKFTSIVWIDEFKFGWIGGNWLREKLGDKGNIVVLEGIAGTSTSDLRTRGALDALGPNVTVLARQPAGWAYDKGKTVMEDFIAAYPQIDGVYSQGGAMSQAAVDALNAANRPLVPITGEGYNGFLKTWLANRDAGFSSVGPDEPTWQSVRALELLTACLSGESVRKWEELPLPVITDENVGDYALTNCPDDVWANTKMDKETISSFYQCK